MLDTFFRMAQARVGEAVADGEEWKLHSQGLARKLFSHLVSLRTLCHPQTAELLPPRPAPFIDQASVNVVARAALETYLVYHYIFGPHEHALSHFRYLTWELDGLTARQQLFTTDPESLQKQAHEKERIATLRQEIQKSKYFSALKEHIQIGIIKGDWRKGYQWHDLAVDAGMHETMFRNIYKNYCGYSHSGYISVLQVGQADALAEQHMLARVSLGVGLLIMAHFLTEYGSTVERAKSWLDRNPTSRALINQWKMRAEEWQSLYNTLPKQPPSE